MQPNFTSIIQNCNLWRNYDDIQDSWSSVESIIDYFGNNQDVIVPNAGPGHWNDPDMVSRKIFHRSLNINEWNSSDFRTQFQIFHVLSDIFGMLT